MTQVLSWSHYQKPCRLWVAACAAPGALELVVNEVGKLAAVVAFHDGKRGLCEVG